jgi:hypothetical protein
MIRNLKPRKIIEIGSGFSTLLALEAIRKNALEGHTTELFCIEPYEWNWLNEYQRNYPDPQESGGNGSRFF